MSLPEFDARIVRIAPAAIGIVEIELTPVIGDLPPFTAGAHIDLRLGNGLVRNYSLMNPPHERQRYVIAVQREPQGRGGSAFVHDALREGDVVRIVGPRNHFALQESAARTVLIGGGIGVTPLLAMAERLDALGRPWRLHYCARTREHAIARARLAAFGDKVRFNFDQEPGGRILDLADVIDAAPADTHFYCCGPLPMLAAFESAMRSRPAEFAHVEYFTPKPADAAEIAARRGFTIELARSGGTHYVEPGKSILDTLMDAGHDVTYSCMEGVCGSCETGVLEGIPEHHDCVLSDAEQTAGKTMMICCSRCKGERLVLDL